ncbi:MAG: ATP-binding cassette domain-containing protein [Candidatus Marinimicrobia bacterium]|nr:ATP-binding cassette domain-containing protein [Candidatus Neomarinimicrobiota bacterium]MDD5582382.1 ATP-binding cassette domain-containing protein [Candidatus Neomarinimicrobiota bacterium]
MIECIQLTVDFGNGEGIRNITTHFYEGDFTLLLGPTGCGKSTLMRIMYMDILPTRGYITIRHWDSRKISKRQILKLRQGIGIIFQDFRLIENLSVFENVALPLIMTGQPRKNIFERVQAILDEIGLLNTWHQKAGSLSGGEKQRVAIARAIVKKPFLVLADEPTGNLDPEAANTVFELLKKINALGTTVIMATHNYTLIEDCDYRRIYMENGSLVDL